MRFLIVVTLMFQSAAFAQGTTYVFGLICNEPFVAITKKIKVFELSEDDIKTHKVVIHPIFWNTFVNDEGYTKSTFNLPEKNIEITLASLRFVHNALADVSIQFSPQTDDNKLTQGSDRAREIAFSLGRKYKVFLPTAIHNNEGFMGLSHYTDWEIKTPNATVIIGSRYVTYESDRQHFRSAVLARVRFSENCGQGRRVKAIS